MDRKHAEKILERYRQGTATPEEKQLLDEAFLSFPLSDQQLRSEEAYKKVERGLWQQISHKTIYVAKKRPLYRNSRRYAAVVVLLILTGTGYWFWDRMHTQDQTPPAFELLAMDVSPGSHRAILTLADGTEMTLSEAHAGIVIRDSTITYTDGSALAITGQTEMLSLSTPKGGTYQVTLPDGSEVWLNAASTLRYPSRFSPEERTVYLEGEAYFSVDKSFVQAPNARAALRPFKVISKGQEVEVLGTQFNIAAYPEEVEIRTTLVEGAVLLRTGMKPQGVPLEPGEQGIVLNGDVKTHPVDIRQYTSWKEGYFAINGSIPVILKEISRWYDLDLLYQDFEHDTKEYLFTFPRNLPLGQVLNALKRVEPQLGFELTTERRLRIFRKSK